MTEQDFLDKYCTRDLSQFKYSEYCEEFRKQVDGYEHNIMAVPTSNIMALNVLEKYLLGDDWYCMSTGVEQGNTEIVWAILRRYSKSFNKELKERERLKKKQKRLAVWKKKHGFKEEN